MCRQGRRVFTWCSLSVDRPSAWPTPVAIQAQRRIQANGRGCPAAVMMIRASARPRSSRICCLLWADECAPLDRRPHSGRSGAWAGRLKNAVGSAADSVRAHLHPAAQLCRNIPVDRSAESNHRRKSTPKLEAAPARTCYRPASGPTLPCSRNVGVGVLGTRDGKAIARRGEPSVAMSCDEKQMAGASGRGRADMPISGNVFGPQHVMTLSGGRSMGKWGRDFGGGVTGRGRVFLSGTDEPECGMVGRVRHLVNAPDGSFCSGPTAPPVTECGGGAPYVRRPNVARINSADLSVATGGGTGGPARSIMKSWNRAECKKVTGLMGMLAVAGYAILRGGRRILRSGAGLCRRKG